MYLYQRTTVVKGLLIERVISLKTKYKVLLVILGILIFLIAMLLFWQSDIQF